MIDTKSSLQQLVLSSHHVVVVVLGKMGVQSVARLARFSVPDVIGKDDEIAVRIQQLAGAKQHICKLRSEELPS